LLGGVVVGGGGRVGGGGGQVGCGGGGSAIHSFIHSFIRVGDGRLVWFVYLLVNGSKWIEMGD